MPTTLICLSKTFELYLCHDSTHCIRETRIVAVITVFFYLPRFPVLLSTILFLKYHVC